MCGNVRLAILGGDLRQLSIARHLSELGFDCAVWGLGGCEDTIGDAVRCRDWRDAIMNCRGVILPLPASADGVTVNCPLNDGSIQSLSLSLLFETVSPDTVIIGGKFTPAVINMAQSKGRRIVDYFESEELQIKNTVPTAEGAIAIAMNELPVTINGSKMAVIGYGRVGKMLADKLYALGADVTVAARKSSDLAWAKSHRYSTLKIETCHGVSTLLSLGAGYDVIFNTVPYWLFDKSILSRLDTNTLIIDLASAPGGVDSKAAGECGVRVIWALSLPGKCAPFTAGKIICESINDILISEGVIV